LLGTEPIPIPVPLVHFKVNQQQKITSDLRPFWLDSTSTFYLFGDCMIALFICMCVSGWWFQPLRKILVSWDDYSQYMEK